MIRPSEVMEVLAAAMVFDQRFRTPDKLAAKMWTAGLQKYDLPLDVLLEAVAEHYADETRSIMVSDINRLGRKIREKRAEHESEAERDARALRNDRRLGLPPSVDPGAVKTTRDVKALISSLADQKAISAGDASPGTRSSRRGRYGSKQSQT